MGGTLGKNLTSSVSRGRFRLMELEGTIDEQTSTPVSSARRPALSPVLMKAPSKAPMSSSVEKMNNEMDPRCFMSCLQWGDCLFQCTAPVK